MDHREILNGAELISTKLKQEIFLQGDPAEHFGFVVEGVFRLYRFDPAGQRVIMDFVSPGGMVAGLLMAPSQSVYPVTVQSIERGQFLKIPKSTYKEFWSPNSEIMQRVQIANMERVQSLQNLREVQRLPLEQKIAWTLLKVFRSQADQDRLLKSVFSRADLGDAIGAASESIIRTFSLWTKEGLIRKRDGHEYIDLNKIQDRYFKNGI